MSSRENQVCTIALQHEVAVDLAIDQAGRPVRISADFRAEHWKQALELAALVRRVIAEIGGCDESTMHISQQYVLLRPNAMQPQVCIDAVEALLVGSQKVGMVARTAVEFLTGQMQMPLTEVDQGARIGAAEAARVRTVCAEFLDVHGGASLRNSLAIVCADEIVASATGRYQPRPVAEVRTMIRRLDAMYDGRHLRHRLLFATEMTKQAREFEISYDEGVFDAPLRALGEDKLAELELEVEETEKAEGKKTYRLLSLRRKDSDPLRALSVGPS